jgi:hypothetical protein
MNLKQLEYFVQVAELASFDHILMSRRCQMTAIRSI